MAELRGPLGIWTFPLLTFLRDIISLGGARSGIAPRILGGSPTKLENVETIVWTDWKGRERPITIHREVTQA